MTSTTRYVETSVDAPRTPRVAGGGIVGGVWTTGGVETPRELPLSLVVSHLVIYHLLVVYHLVVYHLVLYHLVVYHLVVYHLLVVHHLVVYHLVVYHLVVLFFCL